MGKKVKTGKSRQDKFYKLAKETGYRSRAAFKLIQLNRKFGFLQNARVCVDLCAAPGGWMQVAHQNMPLSSLIIGVDLVPIKQVGTCVTFAEDIKSEKCRQLIKKELKTWDVDIFLHDGAPNVGKNWIFDAYQQNELTLFALKLATEFMKKGGWFVTKVFRSKDYHALMWLFKKLFKKVFATKPQASRHESAEIFIVCEGFLKPDKIDPRLLDPKHIFKEMEKEVDESWEKGNQVSQLFKVIEKEKKKPVGYEEGETIIFKKVSVKDYLANETFAELLANYNEIDIDDDECLNHETTTTEVKECCKDLRVLGRKELKLLISWRKKLLKYFEDKKKEQGENVEETEDIAKGEEVEMDGVEDEEKGEEEEDDLDAAIKATVETEKKEEKKKKKKEAKKKQKLRERIAMKMVHVGDKFDETRDDEMFDLKRVTMGAKGLKSVVGGDEDDSSINGAVEMPEVEESESSDEDDPLPMKKKLVSFKKTDDDDDDYEISPLSAKKDLDYMGERVANETVDSDEEEVPDDLEHDSDVDVQDEEEDDNMDDDSDVDDTDESNPLIQSLAGDKTKEERLKRKTSVWFAKDVFNDVDDDDEDDEFEINRVQEERRKKRKKEKLVTKQEEKKLGSDGEGKKEDGEDDSDSDDDSDDDSESEDEQIKRKIRAEETEKRRHQKDDFEVVPASSTGAKGGGSAGHNQPSKAQMLDPEGLAIASYMIQSRKNRREIEESGFNRWVNNDKHLPDWFVKDEKMHWRNRAPVQITKEMVEEYKKREMEINARPIKKVAEAKARKKKKALKQLEKVKKKAEAVVEKEGMGEKEKALEIRKMYKKALNRKKTETKLVVSKKGGKGVKGSKPAKGTKYKVVDARLKKDKRAAEKNTGGKKGGKKGKSGGPAKKGGAKSGAKAGKR